MSKPLLLLLAAGVLAIGACATTPAAEGGGAEASTRRSAGMNTLLPDEIAAAAQENLRDVVVSLRPRWLQNTSAGSIASGGASGGVVVFINGQLGGGLDALAQVPKRAVARMTYLSTTEAQSRYGSRVRGPVIDVRLQTGG